MPNQRRDGQVFLGFQADEALVIELDRARKQTRKDRSLFIREAIAAKLRGMGISVPDSLIYPPDRAKTIIPLRREAKLARAAEEPPSHPKKKS